jgi:pimeloyl-ACP methyl ester carboxylesterase
MQPFEHPVRGASGLSHQASPFWGALRPGPHAVGFNSIWELDWSRSYNTIFPDETAYASGKAPRPILINTWYPAKQPVDVEPIRLRDYLAIETDDPRLSRFAANLADYERATICRELLGKAAAELAEEERRLLDEVWDTPTASLRNAPPVDGKFPLVVYHSGAGSSFEDNAVLCEFLASHGYVVLGSAYQQRTGHSLNVDVRSGSARDMEFLIRHARGHACVDWHHIGVAGHSAGAQAALLFRSQYASVVDAVVSLDTTQDYYGLASPHWHYLTKRLRKKAKNLNGPILMVANSHAFFELADSLKDADRYYLAFNNLGHNDFISQGIINRTLAWRANPDNEDVRASLESSRAGYQATCECVLEFFNAWLGHQETNHSNLLNDYMSNRLGGPAPHVEHVPRGVTGPEPFPDGSSTAPQPRQFRPLLAERGAESMIGLLEHYHATDPTAPIFHGSFGSALVDELLETKRHADAIRFYQFYLRCGENILSGYLAEGNMLRGFKAFNEALPYYEKALILDPANQEAAEGLAAVRKSRAKAKKPGQNKPL